MAKYEKLADFLNSSNKNNYVLTFLEIEKIIDEKLPPSAHRYPAWWANHDSHPLMRVVLDAGWTAQNVDFKTQNIEFVRNFIRITSFDGLKHFILHVMRMERGYNYQPVMLRTLLENNGSATRSKIIEQLHKENPQLTKSHFNDSPVFDVLVGRGVVEFDKRNHTYKLIAFEAFDSNQILEAIKLCNDAIVEANEIGKNFGLSNAWLWSITRENWEIVKRKDIWASRVREQIRKRVRKFDKIVFYVIGTSEFQGIYEIISDWYDATEPVWTDEQDAIKYPSQIRLKPLRFGNVNVYDIAPKLKLFPNPNDKRRINLVLKGSNYSLSNNGRPIPPEDYQTIFNSMNQLSLKNYDEVHQENNVMNNKFEFYIALGPWSNWNHTLKHPPFRWGVRDSTPSNVGVYDAMKEGDIVFYYANQDPPTPFTKRGLFGVGRVVRKYLENEEKYWPDEQLANRVMYKHRFDLETLKIVQNTEDLLPWVEGLPFTKGLNHIVDKSALQKLLQHALIKWSIDLDPILGVPKSDNYLLLRHVTNRENPWNDDFGKSYHFAKIANYTKLTPGSRVIWYDKLDGKYVFLGHGSSGIISESVLNGELWAPMTTFEKFDPPKYASEELRSKITSMPNFNTQHSILPITKEIYDEIVYGAYVVEESVETFDDEPLPIPTSDDLKDGYEKISEELLIPKEKVIEIITALASGRHVLLAGPIGTGKTQLAKRIPEIFWEKLGGYYSEDHTATADWSTQDVIGGIFPKMSENGEPIYEIQNGCVTETVQKNWVNEKDDGKRRTSKYPEKNPPYRGTWLTIDEFNRANIDKAFGQLFTALRTFSLKIPTNQQNTSYKTLAIPKDYRIIGTLNTADKHYLFQLSDALKSRFAYIEIDIPKTSQFEQEIYYAMKNALSDLVTNHYENLVVLDHQNKRIDREKSNPEFVTRAYQAYHFLDSIRIFKKLGTAILKLVYQNLLVGTKMTNDSKIALDNALTSNLIPQLENLSQAEIEAIHALHSDGIIKYVRDAYKNPNKQSYVEAIETVLDYLQILNSQLLTQFTNGTLNVVDVDTLRPIQTAYDSKKKEFELDLTQLKQSMEDLIQTTII